MQLGIKGKLPALWRNRHFLRPSVVSFLDEPSPTPSAYLRPNRCDAHVCAAPPVIDRVIELVRGLDDPQDVRALCEMLGGGPTNRVPVRAV